MNRVTGRAGVEMTRQGCRFCLEQMPASRHQIRVPTDLDTHSPDDSVLGRALSWSHSLLWGHCPGKKVLRGGTWLAWGARGPWKQQGGHSRLLGAAPLPASARTAGSGSVAGLHCCCRRLPPAVHPLDTRLTECGYFFRRVVWELLLQLLGAGAACSVAAPGSFLGAGLCFSSRGGGEDRAGWGPSRACMTLTAPTARTRPQSRVGASRGESCFRTQRRARARGLLGLRARGGLLSCGAGLRRVGGARGGWRSTPSPLPAWLAPLYLEAKLPEQHVQRWVPQRHRREEFLHPLAAPPAAAGGHRSLGGAKQGPGPRPQGCPSLTPAPQAVRTSTCSAGPAHRWAAACGRGTWPRCAG